MKIEKNKVEEILKQNNKSIHFIGIGGKGLNGIAKICLKMGYVISGSDTSQSSEIKSLKNLGIKVFDKHLSFNINKKIDLVVKTSIVRDDNPEIVKAKSLNIPIIKRSEFLGILAKNYVSISIAGSHGKSTTTALCGLSMHFAGQDPTIFGGAHIKELGSYEKLGLGKYAVIEACEYDRSFMDLIGDISIITSLEKSHMEYYKTEAEMLGAFRDFVDSHSKDSLIIGNGDNFHIRLLLSRAKCKTFTYGFNKTNDFVITDTKYEDGATTFSVENKGEKIIKDLRINIPGTYNVLNFTANVVLMNHLGVDMKFVHELGEIFTGVGRRFEVHPINQNLTFVDDFCHHPTQVKNLFDGIEQFFPKQKVCAVFQPRQYHLIKTFLKEYGSAFKKADKIFVTDIVPALGDTKEDEKSLNVKDIIRSIKNYSYKSEVEYVSSLSDIKNKVKDLVNEKTIITTIGAGDVYKIREEFINSKQTV